MAFFLWTCLAWMSLKLIVHCWVFAVDGYPITETLTHGIAAGRCVIFITVIAWIVFLLFGQ